MADNRVSIAEYHRLTAKKGKRESRYGADRRIKVGGETFASKGEYRRFEYLQDFQRRGVIRDLQRQVPFPIEHNGVLMTTYMADAVYTLASTGQRIVEDYKGLKKDKESGKEKAVTTEVFSLKRKMMKAFYGVEIMIITKANYWDPSAAPMAHGKTSILQPQAQRMNRDSSAGE